MKLLSFLISTVFLLLSVSLSEAADAIKIAAVFSKTGKAAQESSFALKGVQFAVEEINQQGGILGKKLELLEFDNKSTTLGSKIAAKKAMKTGVVTVFGALWSSHSIAIANVVQKAKIPMISPGSTNPEVTLVGDYIFRACYIDSFQGRVMANFAFNNLKAKTACVLTNVNSKYSEGLAQYFIKNFQDHGGTVTSDESYLDQTADFTSLINKIKAHQSEVIFLPGHTKDTSFIIKQARNSGVLTTFIGGDGWNNSMYEIVGNVIEGSFFSEHWHKDKDDKKSRQFVKKYSRRLKECDSRSALSYDSVFLFAEAVRRAGSFKPIKIREALAATENFRGVTGNISFDKNGDPIKSAVILKFEKGTSVYVKTIEP